MEIEIFWQQKYLKIHSIWLYRNKTKKKPHILNMSFHTTQSDLVGTVAELNKWTRKVVIEVLEAKHH